MAKNFFIIGMRRSGTSILRDLLIKHPEIKGIEFEPHPLWNAVDLLHFKRYANYPDVRETIKAFAKGGKGGGWYGAKFALNPGVKAMEWIWLPKTFPEARIIFIVRDMQQTYKSYCREDRDAVRGIVPEEIYIPFWKFIIEGFNRYLSSNPEKASLVNYEALVKNADRQLEKVWACLGIKRQNGFNKYMRVPRNWGLG